jgi:hypothetical protein
VLIGTKGLASFQTGRGSQALLFRKVFHGMRLTPPPLAGLPVWCGLQWLSPRHQARPCGDEKSLPSLYPSWLFSWAMSVLPHKTCCTRQCAFGTGYHVLPHSWASSATKRLPGSPSTCLHTTNLPRRGNAADKPAQ